MKKIKYLIVGVLALSLTQSCTDESTVNNPSLYELELGGFAKFAEGSSIPGIFFEPQNIIASAEVTDANNNIAEYTLMLSANLGGVTYGNNNYVTLTSFPGTVSITSQKIADALDISIDDIGYGDSFNFIARITTNTGAVYYGEGQSYDNDTNTVGIGNTDPNLLVKAAYDSAMNFVMALACPPSPEGRYTIEMHDSWGDGWQTDDGNGGSGISITIDGEVNEVGMCTAYTTSSGYLSFNQADWCVKGDSYDATGYFDMPAGASVVLWQYPGDAYGEISFEIYSPDGTLIGEYGENHPPGLLILCDSDLGS